MCARNESVEKEEEGWARAVIRCGRKGNKFAETDTEEDGNNHKKEIMKLYVIFALEFHFLIDGYANCP